MWSVVAYSVTVNYCFVPERMFPQNVEMVETCNAYRSVLTTCHRARQQRAAII